MFEKSDLNKGPGIQVLDDVSRMEMAPSRTPFFRGKQFIRSSVVVSHRFSECSVPRHAHLRHQHIHYL
jgi:hypothetical protein